MSGVPLKESAFAPERLARLGADIRRVHRPFPADEFERVVRAALPPLELKARIALVSDTLARFLPADYGEAVEILLASLPEPDGSLVDNDFGWFVYAPHSHFVATHGLGVDDLDFSLRALAVMTKAYSAEEALRFFLNAHEDETMAAVTSWTSDPDHRVRRLASEGTRPRLPWAIGITISPQRAVPILDALHGDESRFVTRSVANHLNDLSRIDMDLVIDALERWDAAGSATPKERAWIARQALRTALKAGDEAAFRFLGYTTDPEVTADVRLTAPTVEVDADLELEVVLRAQRDERLIVDFAIAETEGSHRRQVFRLRETEVSAGQALTVVKRRPMRSTSTRAVRPGPHRLTILVNGQSLCEVDFLLI